MSWRKVIDKQWEKISEYLPVRKRSPKGCRPSADNKKCFEGILWILWTGVPWSELPSRYGSKRALLHKSEKNSFSLIIIIYAIT